MNFPKEDLEGSKSRIVRYESASQRDGLSLFLSRSKEMERKLIGAVNVNTRMDVRDRKLGLVNWLTVSPLFLLREIVLSARYPPSLPLSRRSYPQNCFAFPIFAVLSRYLLRFLLLRLSSGSPPTKLSARTLFDLAFGRQSGFLI